MKKCALAAVVFSMLGWLASPVGAVTIDSFEDGAFSLTSTSPNNNSGTGTSQTGLDGVLGGERIPSTLIWDQGFTSGSATLALDLSNQGDHGVSLIVPAGRTATGNISWLGLDTAMPGGAFDFNWWGDSAFLVEFSQDPGAGTFGIDVNGPAGKISHSVALTGEGTYEVPFSAFNPQNDDFAHVTDLNFYMICTAGDQTLTATLADIRAVPEPSSLVLLIIGGLGLLGFARRRRA